jgi:hypothetical protein
MKAIGAVPVSIGLGDWYTSLERGLVEGIYFLFPVLSYLKARIFLSTTRREQLARNKHVALQRKEMEQPAS